MVLLPDYKAQKQAAADARFKALSLATLVILVLNPVLFPFLSTFKAGQQDSDDVRQPMEISHDGLGPFDQPRSQRQKSQRKSLLYCYRRSNRCRNAIKN